MPVGPAARGTTNWRKSRMPISKESQRPDGGIDISDAPERRSASVRPNVQGSSVKVDHKSVLSANQSGLSGAARRWSRSSVRLNRCANIHSVLCFLIAMVLSDALRGGRYPLIPPKVVRSYPAANGPVLCQTAFTAPDPDELMLLCQSSRKDARNQVSCGFHGKPTHRFADAMIAATWGICRRW